MTDEVVGPKLESAGMRAKPSTWICLVAATFGTLISLLLRWLVPFKPGGFAITFYDDGLFEREAVSLSNHAWLGAFDPVTLSKGPSYPIFVAATHKLGIPLPVGEQLTLLLAAGCIAGCAWLVTHQLVGATAIYLVVALDPVNWVSPARVLRDNWYASLSLLFVSLVFLTTLLLVRRTRLWYLVPCALLTGLTGAVFWLCREEGIWIVPSVLVIVVVLPLAGWLRNRRTVVRVAAGRRPATFRVVQVALVLGLTAVTFYAPIAFVSWKNERVYGVNLTTDFSGGAFPEAMAAWSRVRGVGLRDFIPIDQEQRNAVYAISPTARELRATLEDPKNPWLEPGCISLLKICDDFAGGWESWAIRSAAAATGHFGSAEDFQEFFSRLAREINAACDSGALDCSVKLPTSMQALQRAAVLPTLQSAVHWLQELPGNPVFYTFHDDQTMFTEVSAADRAALAQGITGVPSSDAEAAAQVVRYEAHRWIYDLLGQLFRYLFVALLVASMLGLILGACWRKERPRQIALWVLSGSLAVGIAVRLVMLAVLDTTLLPIDPRYHLPTRLFLLVLAAIGTVNLWSVVRVHFARRQVRASGGFQRVDNPQKSTPEGLERGVIAQSPRL